MKIIKNKFHIKSLNKYYHYNHKPDYVFTGHRHGDLEVNVILNGSMEITCEDGIYSVGKGEMVLMPSFAFHQNRVKGNRPAEMIVIQFEAREQIVSNFFSVYSMDNNTNSLLKMFMNEMESDSVNTEGDCVDVSESALNLLEVFLQYSFDNEKFSVNEVNGNSFIYNKAVKYMQENLHRKLTVSDIAKECRVCSTTLKKLFSYYTGMGCISFFNEMKLKQAKELLVDGKSCMEVSEELGFSSQGYFSRRFKKMYGEVPVMYRKL